MLRRGYEYETRHLPCSNCFCSIYRYAQHNDGQVIASDNFRLRRIGEPERKGPNVKYANIPAKCGFNDPCFGYWEAAKWVAKLRPLNTDGGMNDPDRSVFILDCKRGLGHGGVSGRYDLERDKAFNATTIVDSDGKTTKTIVTSVVYETIE
ncbi:hypothetical protein HK100_002867 [Physocladia obscura]|uniref:Uncharacterized protein n=1 Tax=Physocladia obscura TaxID=109957 RepID=A0AAD5SWB8_9FUNG|nr:hypothetical protein HK100_002867 [Physocladia obscura]